MTFPALNGIIFLPGKREKQSMAVASAGCVSRMLSAYFVIFNDVSRLLPDLPLLVFFAAMSLDLPESVLSWPRGGKFSTSDFAAS